MRDLIVLLVHVITTVVSVFRPGGVRAVIAESVLAKHQLLILNRSRQRAPNLRTVDRLISGFCSLWIRPTRLRRVAIAFRPSTFLNFHRALVQRKYRLLFSPKRTKPGPKGPTADLIQAVVEMKRRNPTWGCPQIAEQINLAFGTSIPKELGFQKRDQSWKPVGTLTLWLCVPGTAMRAPGTTDVGVVAPILQHPIYKERQFVRGGDESFWFS